MWRTKSSQAWHLVDNQVMQLDYWIGASTKRDFMAVKQATSCFHLDAKNPRHLEDLKDY